MSDQPAVLLTIDGPIASIVLNRPDKRNAINEEVMDGICAHLAKIEVNPDIRVVLLSGAGKMFSSGIDGMWLGNLGNVDEPAKMGPNLRILINKIQSALNAIERLEKPVIAAIHGRCVGLGLELALACDFRIAEENALISLPEVVLGLIPDCGGTTRVTRYAGPAVAKEVIMLCEPQSAARYAEWNLITRVCPAGTLDETVRAFAAVLLEKAPRVLGIAKRLIDRSAGVDKMTSMELEAYANSSLVLDPDFPAIMMGGFQKLREKK